MASERKTAPFEAQIPVPWSDRPMVVKTSFWLAVVLAFLILAFAVTSMWNWDLNRIIGRDSAPVVTHLADFGGGLRRVA